ncbi:MAG: Ldh family oxidoreductase [Anaerolineaceae bacterium]|nr:Ldh family oxidoreductase [Anaerolineaceae bacterium]
MNSGDYYLPVDTARKLIKDVFIALEVPKEDADTSADVLITSDLRGIQSHGIGRLKYYYDRIISGQHNPITKFEILRETPATAVVNGNHGMGMVIGTRAMNLAIRKARNVGMGSVAVRNSTHFGIAGYYPLMATKSGMIGMSFTNARPSIAPTFGVQPMLGTNPIAFGAPTDEDFPYLFDAATSITQRGRVEVLKREEKNVPEGLVIGQGNDPLTDPAKILLDIPDGLAALLPLGGAGEDFGGHKGYGLATIVEILSASLQGGSFLHELTGFDKNGDKRPFRVGHFFMAIDIEIFSDLNEFKKTTGEILRQLRSAQKVPGSTRIYTAGEKEFENERRVLKQGIPINPNLQKEILFLKRQLNLRDYEFLF